MSLNKQTIQDMLDFARRLIRTPSLPGHEENVAQVIEEEMKGLGYTEVWRDEVGNVIGRIEGDPSLPKVLLTAHMDHVQPGNLNSWIHDPYSADIEGDWLYGRGASDTKGAIATQVYIRRAIKASGIKHGDVVVAEVVQEETGGLGSSFLVKHLQVDYAVMGEGTSNEIRIGNPGRVLLRVHVPGEKVHASVATATQVAHYRAAEFLLSLRDLPMKKGALGRSSAVPTLYTTDQLDTNVTPSFCDIMVDWRSTPEERHEEIIERVKQILPTGSFVQVEPFELTTYTGMKFKFSNAQPPYRINPDHPYVRAVHRELEKWFERSVPIRNWEFTTDCGIFMEEGIPIIGFSPCDEKYAHTVDDRVSVKMMIEALSAYPSIIAAVGQLGHVI